MFLYGKLDWMRDYDMEQIFVTYENGYDNNKLGYSVKKKAG